MTDEDEKRASLWRESDCCRIVRVQQVWEHLFVSIRFRALNSQFSALSLLASISLIGTVDASPPRNSGSLQDDEFAGSARHFRIRQPNPILCWLLSAVTSVTVTTVTGRDLDTDGGDDPFVHTGSAHLLGILRVWEIILIAFFAGVVNAFDCADPPGISRSNGGREDLPNASR